MGDPRATASNIRKHVTSFSGISISQSTVQRRLRAGGLFGRRSSKKTLVTAKNRKARFDFARKHLAWNRDDWKKVLFSDESKFCLFESDGIMYIGRPVYKRLIRSTKSRRSNTVEEALCYGDVSVQPALVHSFVSRVI
ncbi:hypothetical protein V3C99_019030 [Haemonchus contortus]